MGAFFNIIDLQPLIHIGLQLFDRFVQLLPKRHSIELVEDGLVKPFTDPVGLGALCLGARMINILQRQIQLVLSHEFGTRFCNQDKRQWSC